MTTTQDSLRKAQARAKALHVLLNGRTMEPPMSPTMRKLLDDLRQNGPLVMILGWPHRNGKSIFYKHRATSMTFDALEKRGLIQWTVTTLEGRILRVYEAL